MSIPKPNLTTAEKLEVILADIDDAVLVANLRNTFFLVDRCSTRGYFQPAKR